MKWNIVADSSCDMFSLEREYENILFSTVPFSIHIGDSRFEDDQSLDADALVNAMSESASCAKTACPPPGAWYQAFSQEGNVIAVTISSRLSGSLNSASAARQMVLDEDPDKKIALIDSLSAGPALLLLVRGLCELIETNADFDWVVRQSARLIETTHTIFALSSFDNLIKNGRIGKIKGIFVRLLKTLGFLGIGTASGAGAIEVKGVARGRRKAVGAILGDMQSRGTPPTAIAISHCQNPQFAQILKEAVTDVWPSINPTVVPARGLCTAYAQKNGLIVAYQTSDRPIVLR